MVITKNSYLPKKPKNLTKTIFIGIFIKTNQICTTQKTNIYINGKQNKTNRYK